MNIITLVFDEQNNSCEMYLGSKRLETYTVSEGDIVHNTLEHLKTMNVIELEIQYK